MLTVPLQGSLARRLWRLVWPRGGARISVVRLAALAVLLSAPLPILNITVGHRFLAEVMLRGAEEEAARIAWELQARLLPGPRELADVARSRAFRDEAAHAAASLGLPRMVLRDAAGKVLFTTDRALRERDEPKAWFREIVARGRSFSEIVHGGADGADGIAARGDVARSVVPVLRGGSFVGALEIVSDLSERSAALDRVMLLFNAVLFLVASPLAFLALHGAARVERERRAFAESQELLARVFETSPAAIVVCDATDGSIVEVNHAAATMIGAPASDLRGRPIHEFLGNADDSGARESDLRPARSEGQRMLVTARGETLPVFGTSSLMHHDGRLQRVESFVDLSGLKQAERALVRSERLAAVGTLTAGIAHEFNNVHAIAIGFAELLASRTDLDETARAHLSRVRDALDRAADISHQLLVFAGGERTRAGEANLVRVVEDVLSLVGHGMQLSGIRLRRQLAAVPDTAMDAGQVGQVVFNLMINARHALLGRDDRTITVRTGSSDGHVFVSVADTGCGIDRDDLPKIFTPFYSTKGELAPGNSPQAQVRGTGLGLSVSHTIVSNHGGSIHVDSEPGRGSTFTVKLPIVSKAESTAIRDRSDAVAQAAARALRTARRASGVTSPAAASAGPMHPTSVPQPSAPEVPVRPRRRTPTRIGAFSDAAARSSAAVAGAASGRDEARDAREAKAAATDGTAAPVRATDAAGSPARSPEMLPLFAATDGDAATAREPRRPRILVLDDERDVRELLRQFLEIAGFEPLVAAGGEEALSIVRRDPPDVVVVDLQMPEMDGYEFLARLAALAIEPAPEILVVTGTHDAQGALAARGIAGVGVVTKPFRMQQVVGRVAELVATRKKRTAADSAQASA